MSDQEKQPQNVNDVQQTSPGSNKDDLSINPNETKVLKERIRQEPDSVPQLSITHDSDVTFMLVLIDMMCVFSTCGPIARLFLR